MKFKIEPKDFLMFLIYCGLLLYLCALAVSNLLSLINDGTFYGLIPLSAFSKKNIFLTLLLFFGALIFIFTTVSSYIFNREKDGVGFKVEKNKKSDGYSRWAKEKEMKESADIRRVNPRDLEVKYAGIPLINNGKEVWVDDGEYHNLVIGSTGSGKTVNLVFPMVNILAKKGESMVITDPKGEIYKKTAKNLKDRGYNIIVLNFREPSRGNSWNPLSLPYTYFKDGNVDKATELLDDVALNILHDQNNKADSEFWEKGASDYFSGLALGLFKDGEEREVNLNSINYMATVGEERYGGTSNYIKEYFNFKGPDSNEYMFASTTINAPNDTKGGLLSTFRQKIRLFSTREQLSEMLSYSDFDMRDIGRKKTAVFMIIHDEKKTYHTLMTIFIKQCYETLIDVAQKDGGKLKYRTNFILDEFANMPPLKDVDSMVSAARSRDIRFTFIIQNFAQLNDVYGDQVAEVIKGNCGNLVYLISTELKALEEISKMCGEVKSKEKDKTASTPLVTVSDLQKLKMGEAIIIRLRMNPFRTKYTPNFKMDWGEDYPESDYPEREINEIKLFDLKKFVTEEKKKRMMNSDGENSFMQSGPFGMGGFPNPSPFSSGMNPISGMNSISSSNMTSNQNSMFGSNNLSSSPFSSNTGSIGNPLKSMDIDAMMRDIDAKIKELEEEEAKEKLQEQLKENKVEQEHNSLQKEEIEEFEPSFNPFKVNESKPLDNPFSKVQENREVERPASTTNPFMTKMLDKDKKTEEVELLNTNTTKSQDKPKVNIDVDSVIMNDNVITDDEFFDDFFSDDE